MEQFGNMLGFNKAYIQKYETGAVKPTTEFYNAIAQKLNVNLNWFISGIGEIYYSGKTPQTLLNENMELRKELQQKDIIIETVKDTVSKYLPGSPKTHSKKKQNTPLNRYGFSHN